MGRNEWLSLGFLVAAFLGGAAFAGRDGGQVPWFISRMAGLAAFAALSVSVLLGLLVSTRRTIPGLGRAFNFEIHGFVSVLGLSLVAIHSGALLFDGFFHFTVADLLIPFIAPYAPLWTGLGVISGLLMAVVSASFWAKRWIGQRSWRRLHYASFATYVLALVHGLTAGTDTGAFPVLLLYVGSAVSVTLLLALRFAGGSRGRAVQRERRPLAGATPAAVPVRIIHHR